MNWPSNVVKSLFGMLGDLSPSCKEAIRLQSAALDRKLTPTERFGLRLHLVLCQWCRAYGRQVAFLRSAARELAQDDRHPQLQALSPEARERIKRILRSGRE
ncbi:MAG: zf-HC2 domain-containing protein [Limisphaerales bacterium]